MANNPRQNQPQTQTPPKRSITDVIRDLGVDIAEGFRAEVVGELFPTTAEGTRTGILADALKGLRESVKARDPEGGLNTFISGMIARVGVDQLAADEGEPQMNIWDRLNRWLDTQGVPR